MSPRRGSPYGSDPIESSPRSMWLAVVLALLATSGAVLAGVVVSHEHNNQRQLASMREGLELLRIERDVSVVATRFLTTLTMHRYAGGLASEVETTRQAFRESLLAADRGLGNRQPSEAWRPIHTDMSTAVTAALHTFDDARSPAELVSWGDEFLYDFKRVVPTDNLGEWTSVLQVATWVQEASLVPRDYLAGAMARLWREEGRVPVDTSLVEDFHYSLAMLRHIAQSHGDGAAEYTPFEEYLEVDVAAEAGPDFADLVGALKTNPAVRQIEADMPYLLGLSGDRTFDRAEEVFDQVEPFSISLAAQADRVLGLTVTLLESAATKSVTRERRARIGCTVAILLAFFLWFRILQRRWRLEDQLRNVAERDVLTGIGNRYALFAQAPTRLASAEQGGFALIHLDMDDFKTINDKYGHHVGDAALVAFADACRACVRVDKDMVVRLGGDEFVILLFQLAVPEVEAREVIERLRLRLEQPVDVKGHRLTLPASAGFAITTEPTPLQELLVEADLALLAAKERGRSACELFQRSLRRNLVRELETAVADGELRCFFQPQFDMQTSEVSGVEALLRWLRPDREEIQAVKLIEALLWLGQSSQWLEVAMREIEAAWRAVGDTFEGRLWLNLAGCDLSDGSADDLLDVLGATAMPLDRLGVELTEPVLRPDLAASVEKLRRLREAGIAIALDDVGDDRVPMLHLTELPIDVVKLDRGVIDGLDTRPALGLVVESLAGLCERLSLRLVAEGVETAGEETVLRRLGIRYVQGFRFARPLPLPALEELLNELARNRADWAELSA